MALAMAGAILSAACGKEGPPLPPEVRMAERTTDLAAFQDGNDAVLRWSYPSLTTAGDALTDVEAVHVWRAALPLAQEPPPPMTAQDRQMRRQLLESQGELLRALNPDEIAAATRGSAIVFRDNLDNWRGAVEDPDSRVLWYGVRTVCCRRRESQLSNVVRMEPQVPPAPPGDLTLTAGAGGIDLSWARLPGSKVAVERSADGATWKAVSEEPVDGEEWRDTTAPQGRSWSYRVRSVRTLPGGGRVVGQPSDPARIDHPDTYPPATPAGVVCLPEGPRVRVRWQAVVGAEIYVVSRRHGDDEAELLTEEHRSAEYTDDAPPFGEVLYLVTAVDSAGNRSEQASCVVVMGAEP